MNVPAPQFRSGRFERLLDGGRGMRRRLPAKRLLHHYDIGEKPSGKRLASGSALLRFYRRTAISSPQAHRRVTQVQNIVAVRVLSDGHVKKRTDKVVVFALSQRLQTRWMFLGIGA